MRRTVLMCLAMVAACGDHATTTHDAPRDISFQFHATAGWDIGSTPNVVSMTVGGQDVPSGVSYEVNATYANYEDAKAMFAPLPVVITTTTDQRTFALTLGQCDSFACTSAPPPACPQVVISEDDHYFVSGATSIAFGADCGKCGLDDGHVAGWCALR